MTHEKERVPNLAPVDSADAEARALSLFVQEEIGRRLRVTYNAIASEPLPDRLVALLEELSKSDKRAEPVSKSGK